MTFRIIGDQRQRGLEWAVPRLTGALGGWNRASCLILEKNNDIVACVVYNNYYASNSVEISVAAIGGRWLTRAYLAAVFRVPFLEWGVRRVGSSIASDNHKSIRFCEHLGFTREGVIREGSGPGKDLLIYGLLKSECRYLGQELNVKRQRTSGARSAVYNSRTDCIECFDGNG